MADTQLAHTPHDALLRIPTQLASSCLQWRKRYSTGVVLQTSTCTVAAPSPGCTAVQPVRIDFGNEIVRSPHLATDPNGLPLFVWQESTFRSVRMLRCASPTCAGVSPSGVIVVDLGGESDGYDHFAHSSLDAVAFSSNGHPLLLYVDTRHIPSPLSSTTIAATIKQARARVHTHLSV